MKHCKTIFWALLAALMMTACAKPIVKITLPEEPTEQAQFAAEHLTKALEAHGYAVVEEADQAIVLEIISLCPFPKVLPFWTQLGQRV